ncbi:MAG: hypothetical protein KKE86_01490 [Planctomycetes bacterium]|nr:hypothetical protein [Planctomycetota bacterium]MBU4397987.1 hypothetical protein [Planctomycetota bacterium]MCG2684333.1 hypothetical protein [Planctomycetales bacterium]
MPPVIDERSVYQPNKAELQLEWACAVKTQNKDSLSTPEPISPGRMQIADAGILYLSPILRQLYELRNGPESDDYGRLQPTKHAFDKVIDLLIDAAIDAAPRKIPRGCVSTDSEGGVRIEWVRDTSSVHLVVPATNSSVSYVYHEVGNNYATEDATAEGLSHWLKLIAEEP